MKKLIFIFLVLTSMFSFFILYNTEVINVNNKIEKAEHELNYNYRIVLPGEIGNKSQKQVYEILKKELNKYNGNIYFTRIDDKKIIKYVYVTDNNYFSKIKLDNGRVFNKNELESNKYISTQKENNSNEIGIISSLGKNELFEIKPLKNMIKENHALDGQCTVSFKENIKINKFLEDLNKGLNVKGIKLDDSQINTDIIGISNKDILIIGSLYLMVMLLVFYKILKDYKEIGIEKLVGYSNKSIYIKRISFILGIQIISFLIIIPLMSFILIKKINYYYYIFILKYLNLYVIEIGALIVLCSIPFLYLNKIKVMDVIKNKKPTNHIIIFNMIVKIGLIVVFLFILNNGLININRIKNIFTNSFKNWEEVSNYVVIPGIIANNPNEFENDIFQTSNKKLYKLFNEKGAIVANFEPFLDSFRNMRISENPIAYERDIITVNPNYLKKYPVYDIDNKKIDINENDKNYIILVPEKYKDKEEKIKKYYNEEKDTWSDFTKKEKLKIIWIKNNQKLFSMNIDANKKGNNLIDEPLIRVLTEVNGSLDSYDIIMGVSGNPFKIKVNNVKSARNEILPYFEKFGLGKNLGEVVGVTDEVASEIKDVKEMVINLAVEIVILVIGIVLIISQSIYNFMEQYKQYIAIRKLNGYSFFSLYFEYFIITALSWLTEFVVVITSRRIPINNLILIIGISISLEIVIIISVLLLKGRKDIIKSIKGAE